MNIPETAYIGKQVAQKHIVKALSDFFESEEMLLGAFHGQPLSDGGYGAGARAKGGLAMHHYMLVTNQRVIFWARGIVAGSTDGFRYRDIVSVEEARGLLLGEIVLNIRGAKERFRSMVKQDVLIAAKLIREKIEEIREESNPKILSESIPDQIRKLSELKEQGILTDKEFTSKKSELLARM